MKMKLNGISNRYPTQNDAFKTAFRKALEKQASLKFQFVTTMLKRLRNRNIKKELKFELKRFWGISNNSHHRNGKSVLFFCRRTNRKFFFPSRELRCLRNTIHCNLFFTYIFSALLWLMTLSFQVSLSRPGSPQIFKSTCLSTLDVFFSWHERISNRVHGASRRSSLL